jgi:hypothetical protein
MKRKTHLAALRMTARVAFGVALAGCSASVAQGTEPNVSPPMPSDDRDSAADVTPDAPIDEGAEAGTSDDVTRCLAIVNAAFPGDRGTEGDTASDEVRACCERVAAWASMPEGDWNGERWPRTSCCSLLQWRGSVACTPWGPPMPPSFEASEVLG